MHCLEIAADVQFLKPIPDYSDIEYTQRVLAFVVGDRPPEEEIRRLEAFRRVVLRLVEDGLRHEPGCEASSLPYVSLTLKAGEECKKTLWESQYFIEVDEEEHWSIRFISGKDAGYDLGYERLEDALAAVKVLIDGETGRWASRVSFEMERAGM